MKKGIFIALSGILTILLMAGCTSAAASGFNHDRQINVISRENGSGTRAAFIEVLGIEVTGDDGTVRDMTSDDAEIAPGTSIVLSRVEENTYAIGYISLGSLNDNVRAINIDGVSATAANVQNGTYPLFRTFYIAVQEDLDELTADFVNFILSAEGQAVASSRGYVPVAATSPAYVASGNLSGTIVVSGSTSVEPLMQRLREAYEAIHSNVTVEVHAGGSGAGINAAISGLADIGMSSRTLRPSELEEVNAHAIAHDGLAVIVNNENPIPNLTPEQVRQIFVGDITRWNSLD